MKAYLFHFISDVDPKYDALLKEVEIQKRVICELEAEKEILDKKVCSIYVFTDFVLKKLLALK